MLSEKSMQHALRGVSSHWEKYSYTNIRLLLEKPQGKQSHLTVHVAARFPQPLSMKSQAPPTRIFSL